MPRVPTYDQFQVSESAMPGARVSAPNVAASDGATATAIGQGLSQIGQATARITEQANQVRVDDALRRVREQALTLTHDAEQGYRAQKGIAALERESGKSIVDDYGEMMDTYIGEISESLGNPQQRRAFMEQAKGLRSTFAGQVMAHESDQFRDYSLSVYEGGIATDMQSIALNYRDPDEVGQAQDRIRNAVFRQGRLLGKSVDWIEAKTRESLSMAHRTALTAALADSDLLYANAYLDRHSGDMTADDILAVRGTITKEMEAQGARSAVNEAMASLSPQMYTSNSDRAWNITVGAESGGRQFDREGNPLTSPAGAIGVAQVMPDTAPEAAKLAGLPWDEDRYRTDPEYNEAIGRAYFQKQLQDFGGDLHKAWAAYNAGPGATRRAIKEAQEAETQLSEGAAALNDRIRAYEHRVAMYEEGAQTQAGLALLNEERDAIEAESERLSALSSDWLARLPEETRNYVAKNAEAYAAGDGTFKAPTEAEFIASARSRLGPNPSARMVQLADTEASRQYKLAQDAIKTRGEEAVATAMRALDANGGDYSALPLEIRQGIPPQENTKVMDYAKRVAKGDDVSDMRLYNRLASDPAYLAGLSDDEFYALRASLSEADFKSFAKERGDLLKGEKAANGPGNVDSTELTRVLDARMLALGINPKDDDGAERMGAARRFVRQSVLQAQAAAGRKFNDKEIEANIDRLILMQSQGMNAGGWLPFRDDFTTRRTLTMQRSDIPDATENEIVRMFQAAGIADPTDEEVLMAFFRREQAEK